MRRSILNALRLVLALSCMLLPALSACAQAQGIAPRKLLIAYVPYWDQDNAFSSAMKHLDVITDVSPSWYAPVEGGGVEPQDRTYVRIDDQMVTYLHAHGVRVVPVIANHRNGNWDTQTITHILHDPAVMAAHVQAIVNLTMNKQYDGIQIDYEDLKGADREVFSHFVERLGAAIHAQKKLLYVCVHPKESDAGYDERNKAQDYASIGRSADYVLIMIYDNHWPTSPPGPIAPIGWVESVIHWSQSQIPANKIIDGLGLYGYDWIGNNAQGKTWQEVMAEVTASGAQVQLDNASQSPWFRYVSNNVTHEVWFENTQSLAAKLAMGRKYNVAGYSLWRLGGEQPDIWSLF